MSQRILVVDDGLAAVAYCGATPPDLMVLDLMLPGLDGVEVCRQVHQQAHVPVLMLTARTDETDLLVGLGVGADDYLTKPATRRPSRSVCSSSARSCSGPEPPVRSVPATSPRPRSAPPRPPSCWEPSPLSTACTWSPSWSS